jgi:hypothetical protein
MAIAMRSLLIGLLGVFMFVLFLALEWIRANWLYNRGSSIRPWVWQKNQIQTLFGDEKEDAEDETP